MRLRLVAKMTLALLTVGAAVPATAAAHGFFEHADLPIPRWLFAWAAAIVLLVSFVALGVLWSKPSLSNRRWWPLPAAINCILAGRPATIVYGAVGAFLLAVVLWSGLAGQQIADANFAPTFVYVIFWVGLVPVSVLFGDVFRALNPWRSIAHAVAWIASRVAGRQLTAPWRYPRGLGYWPAAAGLAAFAGLELVANGGTEPRTIAIAATVYSTATFAGMAVFGIEAWLDRGEAFSVYFNLFSRIAVFERRGDAIGLRPPLSGLASLPELSGMPALLAVMIGSVTFDGASEGLLGQYVIPQLQRAVESVGVGTAGATQVAIAATLVITVLAVLGFYRLGVAGIRTVYREPTTRRLARTFAHSLVPIALAYVGAHYLTLLLYQGQAITFLASDPLGDGSNLFGMAGASISHSVASASAIWYAQVGLVVSGHVAALTLAHDRSLMIYSRAKLALRSQIWMLAVMIGFTMLALLLLSQSNM